MSQSKDSLSSRERQAGDTLFGPAVREFWTGKASQAAGQRARGVVDTGRRGTVTGGRHMDGFAVALVDRMLGVGVEASQIYYKRKALLPGFFRMAKQWDIVVIREGGLVAALELKSIVGSYGNNLNNRTEEALGSATDFWTAYRDAVIPASPQPWLGYLMVIGLEPASTRPVRRTGRPHFETLEEFRDSSYLERLEILCRKMVRERKYSAACLLATAEKTANDAHNYTGPSADLGADQFLDQLLRHVS